MSPWSAKPERDDYLVASIVGKLAKGGALKDPRPGDRLTPLADHALAEARRSLERVRRLTGGLLDRAAGNFKSCIEQQVDSEAGRAAVRKRLSELPSRPTAADYHKVGKAMRKVGRTEDADWWEAVRQTPPPRADVLNYRCAAEAFDLITFFSAKKPTAYRVRMIAALIREGVTGKPHSDVDMRCSANLVMRDRRRHHPQAFQTPCPDAPIVAFIGDTWRLWINPPDEPQWWSYVVLPQ
jgi:hypothetical protein